jgi:hypothetical protein
MLRSSGAARRALQIRIKPKTPAVLPNLDTTDRYYRLTRPITSIDKALYSLGWTKAICVIGDRNGARFRRRLVLASGELLGLVPGQIFEGRGAALTITDTLKSSSEVYGKIEGFTSYAV